MANDNNIKHYSAADIERYHKGSLSPKERHDLEKAALDDPFLADALEGYANTGVNISSDIAILQQQLAERVQGAKLVPLNKEQKPSYAWLRVAAMIIFVLGAGLLVYQFGFNKKQADIAKVETGTKQETVRATDSLIGTGTTTTVNTGTIATEQAKPVVSNPGQTNSSPSAATSGDITVKQDKPNGFRQETAVPSAANTQTDIVTGNKTATRSQPPVTTPPSGYISGKAPGDQGVASGKIAEKNAGSKEGKEEVARAMTMEKTKQADLEKDMARDVQSEDLKKQNASRKADEQYYRNQPTNTFRGRVTDASNVGVPFANVTNVQDNAGTYTDANGNFILTSPDSVLNVNVRSIGFENNNTQLRNDVSNNRVVLQDDRRSLSEVVLSNQRPNTMARSRSMNIKLEEPEPADGWDNYDAYLVNNLNLPDEYSTKENKTAAVELSFEVDKNGEPVNIRVEKSLCPTCDKEAIRLVKDGPKWKRKAKKGRTTVTIPFNTSF